MRSATATSCLKLTLKSLFHSLKLRLNPPPCQLERGRNCKQEVSDCFGWLRPARCRDVDVAVVVAEKSLECCGIGPRSHVDVFHLSKSHLKTSVLK